MKIWQEQLMDDFKGGKTIYELAFKYADKIHTGEKMKTVEQVIRDWVNNEPTP